MLDSGSLFRTNAAEGARSERIAPAGKVPRSVLLGATFLVAYVGLFELYSGATFHESAKVASIARDVATFIPYLAPLVLIESVARGAVRRALLVGYFALHVLVDVAFESTGGRLDYAFVRDNIAEASSHAGASMVLSAVPSLARFVLLVELALLGAFALRDRDARVSSAPLSSKPRVLSPVVAGVALGLSALAFVGAIPSRDSLTELTSSVVQYYGKNQRMALARARAEARYPLVHEDPLAELPADVVPATSSARPNVVVIMLESFSAGYLGRVAPDGAPYTPTLDRLMTRGLSATRFYGSSVQTCHGQFATLCGLVPSYRKKEAYIAPLTLQCLPNVLREEGYRTAFYAADEAEHFDGMEEFGARIGFEETRTASPRRLTDEERAHVWGWGLEDDVFYEWALRNAAAHATAEKPFFLALAPVSNHYPFNEEKGRGPIVGEASKARGDYTSSLRASDRRLARFFELLDAQGLTKNTLVVVTSDHSFPADEHGSHWNERGFFEESFRIPFVMLWPEHLPARALAGSAFSQIDIAPTVLHILGLRRPVPFEGRSIFVDGPRFLPLVQPYDGQYLGAIDWPFKYREHGRTGEARVFNLATDPAETNPLEVSDVPAPVVAKLRADVERIHLNQALLLSDEVWPSGQRSSDGP